MKYSMSKRLVKRSCFVASDYYIEGMQNERLQTVYCYHNRDGKTREENPKYLKEEILKLVNEVDSMTNKGNICKYCCNGIRNSCYSLLVQ